MSFASDGIFGNAVRDTVIDNDQQRVEDGATKAQELEEPFHGQVSHPAPSALNLQEEIF